MGIKDAKLEAKLLVEDDRVDAMTVKRAFKDLNVTNLLSHTLNGEEALNHLRAESNGNPCVILLDLNMPRMKGVEFLKVVKADDVLKSIPVVVLTTSQEEQDVVESFKLSAAGYIVKLVDYKKFVEAMRLPSRSRTMARLSKAAG
ncbi:MAG: response regulator [Planctomycetota bacterium]